MLRMSVIQTFIKHIAHKMYSTKEMGVRAGIGTHVNKGDKSRGVK